MSGEYDEKFEELTGLVKRTMGGLDEFRMEMRDMRSEMRDMRSEYSFRFDGVDSRFDGVDSRFDGVDSRFDRVEAKLDHVSGRQNDALPRFIEMQKTVNNSVEIQNAQIAKIAEMFNRLDAIKKSLESIDDRQSQIEQEVKNVNSVVSSLVDDVRSGTDMRNRLDETEQRIAKIEEKLAA